MVRDREGTHGLTKSRQARFIIVGEVRVAWASGEVQHIERGAYGEGVPSYQPGLAGGWVRGASDQGWAIDLVRAGCVVLAGAFDLVQDAFDLAGVFDSVPVPCVALGAALDPASAAAYDCVGGAWYAKGES